MIFMGTLRIRLQDLIYARHGKSSVLLACRTQYDISDHIKCRIQRLWLIVPQISHLKSTGQYAFHIKETTIHRISSG